MQLDSNVRICQSILLDIGEYFKVRRGRKLVSVSILSTQEQESRVARKILLKRLRQLETPAFRNRYFVKVKRRLIKLGLYLHHSTKRQISSLLGDVLCTFFDSLSKDVAFECENATQQALATIWTSKNVYTQCLIKAIDSENNNAAGI